jgi:hypothetical protein
MTTLAVRPQTALLCTDCGSAVTHMGVVALARGSSVREPGEPVCASCSAHRTKMVRALDKIPDRLDQIKARRMAR